MFREEDATKLESCTRSTVGWQLCAKQLQRIREQVNELGQLNKHLSESRRGAPRQQTGIDQVDHRLREMEDRMAVSISHRNDNPCQPHAGLPGLREGQS